MKMLFFIQFFLITMLVSTCKTAEKSSPEKNASEIPKLNEISFKTVEPFKEETIFYETMENRQIEISKMVVSSAMVQPVNEAKPIKSTVKPIQKEVNIKQINTPKIHKKTLNEGKVVYKIPSKMKVRNTYSVIVRISSSSINIYENLGGDIRESSIPITETMEVKLIDPSPQDNKAFSIIPDNQAIQFVDSSITYTQWSWNVTPLKSGNTKLKVVVSILRDGKTKQVVYEDDVKVEVNLGKQIGFWFKSYWQWIFITLLLPLFKFIYNKVKKNDGI